MTNRFLSLPCLALLVSCPCVFAQQISNYSTSWIGNTFGGAGDLSTGNGNTFLNDVQMGFCAIGAAPNGTIFTEVPWDESHKEMGIYQSGTDYGQFNQAGPGGNWPLDQWNFNNTDGGGVAVSGSWAFLTIDRTINSASQGPGWLRRYQLSTYNPDPSYSGTLPGDIHVSTNALQGLSLSSSGNQLTLYASASDTNGRIVVFDGNAFAQINQFPFQSGTGNPGRSAIDNNGYLWITDLSGSSAVIRKYSAAGLSQNVAITFPPGVQASDVAFNPATNLLMVADSGSDQDIKFYNPASISGTPTIISGTLGVKGGINSGTDGQVAPLKFFSPSSVCSDTNGNIYVAMHNKVVTHPLGSSLASYSASGAFNWELDNLIFVDAADADPQSETDVYTKDKHFTMNYSNPPGSEWSYAAHTVDPYKYPQDLRVVGTNPLFTNFNSSILAMRRINGHLFMYVTDMYSEYVAIFRFNSATDGDVAVPCGFISPGHLSGTWPPNQPASGEWIWRDGSGTGGVLNGAFETAEFITNSGKSAPSNAWGWNVDKNGNVFLASDTGGIREYPCQGLDSNNIPIYNYATMTTTAMPPPFTDVMRAEYDAANDAMYLSGYTAAYPNQYTVSGTNYSVWGKGAGRVLAKYPNWSKGNRTEAFEIDNLMYQPNNIVNGECNLASIAFAGNYLFVQYGATYPNDAIDSQQTQVYSAATGALIGYFTPSGGASLGPAQIDVPFGMKAYLRTNGEYLIFVEDDWFGKILMYRWTPGAVLSGTAVNCGGTATGSFVADPFSGGNTASTNAGIDTAGVINPAPQAVYQTNRYTTSGTNSFTYTLGGLTPNATYMARLHFAETYFGTAGSREFNVSINNKPVLTNFDIFVAAGGGNMANIQQFWATSGTNGQFTFTFANGSQNNAQCNGIEISPILAAPPSALTATSGSAQIGLSWTASPGADRYNVYRALGTSGSFALLASSTSAGYTDASVSNTTSYCYAVTAVNAGGESADSNQSSTTVILPPLQLWRMQNFGTLNPADPVAGDTADPAACGVSNLTRYALGLSLNGNDPTGLPTVSQSGGYLSLSFTRLKADTDITYHVVAGGDLNLWNEIWNSTAVPYGGSANPQQQVTVPDTVSISSAPGGRRFLKLKVTNP